MGKEYIIFIRKNEANKFVLSSIDFMYVVAVTWYRTKSLDGM